MSNLSSVIINMVAELASTGVTSEVQNPWEGGVYDQYVNRIQNRHGHNFVRAVENLLESRSPYSDDQPFDIGVKESLVRQSMTRLAKALVSFAIENPRLPIDALIDGIVYSDDDIYKAVEPYFPDIKRMVLIELTEVNRTTERAATLNNHARMRMAEILADVQS